MAKCRERGKVCCLGCWEPGKKVLPPASFAEIIDPKPRQCFVCERVNPDTVIELPNKSQVCFNCFKCKKCNVSIGALEYIQDSSCFFHAKCIAFDNCNKCCREISAEFVSHQGLKFHVNVLLI